MRCFSRWSFAFLIGLAYSVVGASGIDHDLVVSWSEQCPPSKQLMIELIVDGQHKYHQAIPICWVERNSLQGGTMSTTLVAKRSYFGEPRLTKHEADFWEAGSDPDALILGISFASKTRIWLNTLHVAFPNKISTTQLAPGVTVRSYPLLDQKPSNALVERQGGR